MKKKILIFSFFLIGLFFVNPVSCYAKFGDVRYQITSVNVNGSKITFTGWAFIHKTNNYTELKLGDKTIDDGGQKILIQAVSSDGSVIASAVSDGKSSPNYNFYCELFDNIEGRKCKESLYNDDSFNNCSDGDVSVDQGYCYYEDMGFSITFDVANWNSGDVYFRIAVSNSFFERNYDKKNYYTYTDINNNKNIYTKPVELSVFKASFSGNSDIIDVPSDAFVDDVKFIAAYGILNSSDEGKTFRPSNQDCKPDLLYGYNLPEGNNNNIYLLNLKEPISKNKNAYCLDVFGDNCKGTDSYNIWIKNNDFRKRSGACYAKPCDPNKSSSCISVSATGSHISFEDSASFNLKVTKASKCQVNRQSNDSLECNNSKTFNSNCESLGISTDKGSANVKIEQTGTVTSVLTPDNIYAGGGFNFGIMYYNTIKWSYVSDSERSRVMGINGLHSAVIQEMNKRIKDYDTYISGLNVNSISLGGKIISDGFLYKSCNTSNSNKDYYNKELTVSCIFHIPGSTIKQDGSVNYVYNSLGNGTNNKYYTPMNYSGKYDIKASIEGMDRITSTYSKSDSAEQGKSWTGKWEDDFTNCSINIYSLIKSANTIYRPIDIKNPFPNRNAGINWYDWIAVDANREKLVNSYNKLDYYAILNNQEIADIKMYNKEHNYLNWDSIDDYTGNSSFITEKDYINRVGDN